MPNRKRLLFVDDEDGIRATLPLILQGHGFSVESAGSVPDALQKIEHDKFDVLVSDLNIAEPQDGFDVVRAMREVNPGCIAVVLTGYPGFEQRCRGHPPRHRRLFRKACGCRFPSGCHRCKTC